MWNDSEIYIGKIEAKVIILANLHTFPHCGRVFIQQQAVDPRLLLFSLLLMLASSSASFSASSSAYSSTLSHSQSWSQASTVRQKHHYYHWTHSILLSLFNKTVRALWRWLDIYFGDKSWQTKVWWTWCWTFSSMLDFDDAWPILASPRGLFYPFFGAPQNSRVFWHQVAQHDSITISTFSPSFQNSMSSSDVWELSVRFSKCPPSLPLVTQHVGAHGMNVPCVKSGSRPV